MRGNSLPIRIRRHNIQNSIHRAGCHSISLSFSTLSARCIRVSQYFSLRPCHLQLHTESKLRITRFHHQPQVCYIHSFSSFHHVIISNSF
ncbi:hypothetical protein CW304_23785 [Bacillus sp. UFRGS-B20]|nr:hypothetical protein CW304_23785 [Bacillus sp. UFRGS-B20]